MQCCCIRWSDVAAWFQRYDDLQTLAVILLYIQVACSLIGSLGAQYSGVLLANLALALFALVAIESGSQSLGRTYGALLAPALLVDVLWFIFFSSEIRDFGKDASEGKFTVFSAKLAFWMQVTSFCIRFLSSFLWVQMYRLGASAHDGGFCQLGDVDGRTGLLSTPDSTRSETRQLSRSSEPIGGSIYDLAFFSPLFEYAEEPLSDSQVPESSSDIP